MGIVDDSRERLREDDGRSPPREKIHLHDHRARASPFSSPFGMLLDAFTPSSFDDALGSPLTGATSRASLEKSALTLGSLSIARTRRRVSPEGGRDE